MNNNNNIIFDIDRLKRKAWISTTTTTNNNNNNNNNDNNKFYSTTTTTRLFPPPPPPPPPPPSERGPQTLGGDTLVDPNVVPSVTVVLEGRSICHRVNLNQHSNYGSLAKTLRRMFADTVVVNVDQSISLDGGGVGGGGGGGGGGGDDGVDLSNAIPGYLVAYEDLEDDLLLAGDLNWKDFVRVAKRIRILPAKPKTIPRNHQNK